MYRPIHRRSRRVAPPHFPVPSSSLQPGRASNTLNMCRWTDRLLIALRRPSRFGFARRPQFSRSRSRWAPLLRTQSARSTTTCAIRRRAIPGRDVPSGPGDVTDRQPRDSWRRQSESEVHTMCGWIWSGSQEHQCARVIGSGVDTQRSIRDQHGAVERGQGRIVVRTVPEVAAIQSDHRRTNRRICIDVQEDLEYWAVARREARRADTARSHVDGCHQVLVVVAHVDACRPLRTRSLQCPASNLKYVLVNPEVNDDATEFVDVFCEDRQGNA